MIEKIKLKFYRAWLHWEISKLHVREARIAETRENIKMLLETVVSLNSAQVESEGES